MTRDEKITICNSIYEELNYAMLHETRKSGDTVLDYMLFKDDEFNERFVLLLALAGIKGKIHCGYVYID